MPSLWARGFRAEKVAVQMRVANCYLARIVRRSPQSSCYKTLRLQHPHPARLSRLHPG